MIDSQMVNISEKLKAFFKRQNMTQKQLKEILGVSQAAISAQLNGKPFGKKQAQKWGKAFGLNPNWLITGEGKMLADSATDYTIKDYKSVVKNPNFNLNNTSVLKKIIGILLEDIDNLKQENQLLKERLNFVENQNTTNQTY
jgi:transcriptional regulator with XRE-family HTH domain